MGHPAIFAGVANTMVHSLDSLTDRPVLTQTLQAVRKCFAISPADFFRKLFSRGVPTRMMSTNPVPQVSAVLSHGTRDTRPIALWFRQGWHEAGDNRPEIKSFLCLLAEGWIPVESRSFALPDRFGAR
jgi:hypothetical protein